MQTHHHKITCTEVIKSKVRKITSSKVKLRVCNRDVPTWMTNTYKHIGFFAFGAVVSQLTTDIGKYSIGRLRPHFFSVSIFFLFISAQVIFNLLQFSEPLFYNFIKYKHQIPVSAIGPTPNSN